MEEFILEIAPGRTVTGLYSIPTQSSPQSRTPLVVAIHGGTLSAAYYDAHPSVSLASVALPLNVPVIALNRPGYGCSTPLAPLQEGQRFLLETAAMLHETILPVLWKRFAEKSGANAIVLHTHSIGAFVGILIAALYGNAYTKASSETPSSTSPSPSASTTPGYPLAGLTIGGIGSQFRAPGPEMLKIITEALPNDAGTAHTWPSALKNEFMMRPSLDLTDPAVIALADRLNRPFWDAEREDTVRLWPGSWREYVRDVRTPVFYGLPEFDCLWETEPWRVDEFKAAFEKSKGIVGGIIPGAPHCVDLSRQGREWTTRCLGFAMECAVAFGLEAESGAKVKL